MIALKDNLPLVRFRDDEIRAFDQAWLTRCISIAAEKADYPFWWLSDHVAGSVTTYLMLDYAAPVIELSSLTKAVTSVLQVIGYAEIASHFAPELPPVQISLLELAENAGTGYELAFFHALRGRIADAFNGERSQVHLVDLHRCVKQIRARRTWSRDCEALQSEIVRFVREQAGSADAAGQMLLTVT